MVATPILLDEFGCNAKPIDTGEVTHKNQLSKICKMRINREFMLLAKESISSMLSRILWPA